MREMILAGIPGLYIFHYGEESGCIGSGDLARFSPEILAGIDFAIALDRAGYRDIVTSQIGRTCTSQAFTDSLSYALSVASKELPMFAGARGVYTDTAEYMDIVPECTNLSVGYFNQHSSREYLDYAHVGKLLSALCTLDQSSLVAKRDPAVEEVRETRIISRRSELPLWSRDVRADHDEWGWCTRCEAYIIDPLDPDYLTWTHCTCEQDEWDEYALSKDLNYGEGHLSDEDRAFLRYLKGL